MQLVYLKQKQKLINVRYARWDELGTLNSNYERFHKHFSSVSLEKADFDFVIEEDLTDEEIISETENTILLSKEQPSEVIPKTLFHSTKFDDIDTSNIVTGSRTRKSIIYSVFISESATVPKSFIDIEGTQDKESWLNAYDKEIPSLEILGEFEVVERPKNKKVVPVIELYVKKSNIRGSHSCNR
eukprot:snap_masked-scaffold_20-processed-gene-5.108-mRNA-1 protein AED:1.00 eAED:1.00 QI:0/0/0/0/1/1/2/0/184